MRYDHAKMLLYVVFISGDVYAYKEVPEKVYKDFKAAISKGTFLNRKIKKCYEAVKINAE
ncbi:KTSC domain-containing protein [Pedobacter insulae]|uniref:KTSC domain-containing protein n=2 Tax=Pedobacter insulae TaxID=414048 RepID=A0A1I2WP04_9SPHI|nr:KTSC domain-containing protein [Pedobacter insulae]